MKIKLLRDGESISPHQIYEDIRVKSEDDTIVEYIPLGDTLWQDLSMGWDPSSAASYVSGFVDYTGDLPAELDFNVNLYTLTSGIVVEAGLRFPEPEE